MFVGRSLHPTMTDTPTTNDIAVGEQVLLLPLGSWEQHGPHLPLDTDSVIISRVIDDALSHPSIDSSHFICAPLLPITASDEHHGFAGGLSTGTDALVEAIVAICRSARTWTAGTLIINGHGGNFDALQRITSALDYEETVHSIWSLPSYAGGDMHAGHTETSLMLHIAPQSVRLDRLADVQPTDADVNTLRSVGVQGVSSSGILGNPLTATPQHGKVVLDLYSGSLVQRLTSCANDWLPSPA